jgi:hypothetical protein
VKLVSYGGGTNSTAMLIGMRDWSCVPDAILFADTGGERPETYEHLERMQLWCKRNGFPEITIIRKGGNNETLEEECLRKKTLPPVAFGFKTCSLKYKIEPFEKWCNNSPECKKVWDSGKVVQKFIGIDADELHRAVKSKSPKYQNEYPLLLWEWGRDNCISAIKKENLPLPGKSACFFCPNAKPAEILELSPELQDRAMAMEENAELNKIKGLGRDWSWTHLIKTAGLQETFPFYSEMPCGCYDG